LFGLFEKWTKEQRKNVSLVGVMVISAALTLLTASELPAGAAGGRFWWLGLAVGGGSAVHCMGDAMTSRRGAVPVAGSDRRQVLVGDPAAVAARVPGRRAV
jgi:hypothetical protein